MRTSTKWCTCVALGVFAFSVVAYGGPRVDKAVKSVKYTDLKVVEIEPPINGPVTLPPALEAFRGRLAPLPQGVPLITREVHMHNGVWVPPGEGSIATGGKASADVYRQNNDCGYFWPKKAADADTFNAAQAGFGGGWVPGGAIDGYDLLTFNSSGNSGSSVLVGSLWDGDPFGVVKTDCSVGGVPAPIPGTVVVFPEVGQAPDTCDPIQWVQRPCAGLTRYKATFDKIQIDCDQVFIMMELQSGCRNGWRFGGAKFDLATMPPNVGFGDVLEELYDCSQGGSCATTTGYNAGFCCDDGSACDETVATGTFCPGRPTGGFCTDGISEVASAFGFGGVSYWATAVSGVTAATDVWVSMAEAAGKTNYVKAEKGGFGVAINFYLSDWDPGGTGLGIKAFQSGVDVNQFATAKAGTMTMWTPACTTPPDCVAAFGKGGGSGAAQVNCAGGFCTPVWIDNDDARYVLTGISDLQACDQINLRCGSTILFGGPAVPWLDEHYLMSAAVWVPIDGKGVWTLSPSAQQTSILDENGQFLPMVGLVPMVIEVSTGSCCDLSVQPFVCVADNVTENECAAMNPAYNYTRGATCQDPCGCNADDQCADGDACTVDECINSACVNTKVAKNPDVECCDPNTTRGSDPDIFGLGAFTTLDDSDPCTNDFCDKGAGRGVAQHVIGEGKPCNDDNICTYDDACLADGSCLGQDVNLKPCVTEDDCLAKTGTAWPCQYDIARGDSFCFCTLQPECFVAVEPSAKPNDECFEAGEKIVATIETGAAGVLVGGQFNVSWDPACVQFDGIATVDPMTTVLAYEVDQAAGTLFWAVGVGFDPASGDPLPGIRGGVFGVMNFTKLPGCGACDICLEIGMNPGDTILSDENGQAIKCDFVDPCDTVNLNDTISLWLPPNMKYNVDCDARTAMVDVGVPYGKSNCGDVNLVDDAPRGVVELTQGVHQYDATVTSKKCGDSISGSWTVTVNDEQSLDVEIQLSPIIANDDFTRCISFELIADCVEGSPNNNEFQMEMLFGGAGDFMGHLTDKIKIKKGQYFCMTAWDQQHTLRSAAMLECVDGQYYAEFKGDPFFGGNWLIGGNLDGWKKTNPQAGLDVIDILDFGQFIWQWGATPDKDTLCEDKHTPNADINGDGMVDMADLNFILTNFMAHSKDACCEGGTAAPPLARTEVSVRELREMGMAELGIADLNADGMIDMADVEAFMNGVRPVKKAPRAPRGSSLGR